MEAIATDVASNDRKDCDRKDCDLVCEVLQRSHVVVEGDTRPSLGDTSLKK